MVCLALVSTAISRADHSASNSKLINVKFPSKINNSQTILGLVLQCPVQDTQLTYERRKPLVNCDKKFKRTKSMLDILNRRTFIRNYWEYMPQKTGQIRCHMAWPIRRLAVRCL